MGIFKRKPGGTKLGNLIRGGLKKIKDSGVLAALPGGGFLSKLPLGEGLFMKKGEDGSAQLDTARTAADAGDGVMPGEGKGEGQSYTLSGPSTPATAVNDGFFTNFFDKLKSGSMAHIGAVAGAVAALGFGLYKMFGGKGRRR